MLLLPILLAGQAIARGVTHTVTVLDDNPDQRTLNSIPTLDPNDVVTTFTLQPSGVDRNSQTKWVDHTGLSAHTTVTKELDIPPRISSSTTPSGTGTHSLSWMHGPHMEIITVSDRTLTRADYGTTHITVYPSTKSDGATMLVSTIPDATAITTVTNIHTNFHGDTAFTTTTVYHYLPTSQPQKHAKTTKSDDFDSFWPSAWLEILLWFTVGLILALLALSLVAACLKCVLWGRDRKIRKHNSASGTSGQQVVEGSQGMSGSGGAATEDSRGTMRRAAEEGRGSRGVRFGEDPSETVVTTTTTEPTHVDGAAEMRSGSQLFDVGSIRGRKGH